MNLNQRRHLEKSPKMQVWINLCDAKSLTPTLQNKRPRLLDRLENLDNKKRFQKNKSFSYNPYNFQ